MQEDFSNNFASPFLTILHSDLLPSNQLICLHHYIFEKLFHLDVCHNTEENLLLLPLHHNFKDYI